MRPMPNRCTAVMALGLALLAGCGDPPALAGWTSAPTETQQDSSSTNAGSTTEKPDSTGDTTLPETDTSADASAGSTGIGSGEGSTGTNETTGPEDTSTAGSSTTGPTPFCGDGEVNTPFEECDVGTPDPDGPCTPTCQRARIIFVLSLFINGKLSGLQGADAYCRSQALKAQMADPSSPIVDATNFKALLPSSQETVFERHFHGEGPYRLVNGLTVSDSFNELFSEPLQNPINVDEFSQTRNVRVVTGLTKDGDSYPGINFCNDWTGVKGSASTGNSGYTSAWWVELPDEVADQPSTDCANNWALYCVEQE